MLTVGLIPSDYHSHVLQIVLIVHFACFRCVEVSIGNECNLGELDPINKRILKNLF